MVRVQEEMCEAEGESVATHRCCPKTKESGKLKKSLHDVSG